MAAKRLTESKKNEVLEGYRSGESTTSLAEAFGCSPNTISRTVKALLSDEEYTSLKEARTTRTNGGSASVENGFETLNLFTVLHLV